MRHALLAILTIFVLALGTPVKAQSFNDGVKAFDVGDYSRAFEIFLPLAVRGDARAQYNLGIMYDKGDGVPQDYAKAARWQRMAAEQGLRDAQYNLGMIYSKGLGVLQSHQKAAFWFRKAAKQGDAEAQEVLGLMYATGQGMARNYVTAHMWVNIANANGQLGVQDVLMRLTNDLTAEKVAQAQVRARKCLNSNYQDCD